MGELLLLYNVENLGSFVCFVFWAICLFLFVWAVFSISLKFLVTIIRHIKTKRLNDKTFKELGFKPQ